MELTKVQESVLAKVKKLESDLLWKLNPGAYHSRRIMLFPLIRIHLRLTKIGKLIKKYHLDNKESWSGKTGQRHK